MSLDENEKLIVIITCSIAGCLVIIAIICLVLWLLLRQYRRRTRFRHTDGDDDDEGYSPPMASHRKQHQRPQRSPSSKLPHRKLDKKKRRSTINDSTVTLSFDPPHLMNQNVKNLDKLLNNETTLTAKSWHYEETLPTNNYYYRNPSNEPVYASSSTVLTTVSNLALTPSQPPLANRSDQFLDELDHMLRSKQVRRPLNYSQSCRPTAGLSSLDNYRSMSPPPPPSSSSSSNIARTSSCKVNSLEPLYVRTNQYFNPALMHRARMAAQLRDDTAILY